MITNVLPPFYGSQCIFYFASSAANEKHGTRKNTLQRKHAHTHKHGNNNNNNNYYYFAHWYFIPRGLEISKV